MSKPEDIPADVFAIGVGIARDLPSRIAPANRDFAALVIARAVLAERERCANIAVARSDHKRNHCDDTCVCDNGYHVALEIRRGS